MQAGLDSLTAVDLRRELTAAFDLDADALSPTLVFDYPSIEAIAEHLLPLLLPPRAAAAPAAAADAAAPEEAASGGGGPSWMRLSGAERRQHVRHQVEERLVPRNQDRVKNRGTPQVGPDWARWLGTGGWATVACVARAWSATFAAVILTTHAKSEAMLKHLPRARTSDAGLLVVVVVVVTKESGWSGSRRHVLAPQVSEVAARIVGAMVPVDEPLMQAGLDSLAAVDLRRELTATFDLATDALAPTLVFDYPSIDAITEHVLPLLPPPTLPAAPLRHLQAAGTLPLASQVEAAPAADAEAAPRMPKRVAPPANPNAPTLTGCASAPLKALYCL